MVSSAPRFWPSSLNWTPLTPTLSEAVAFTATVPDTVAPAAGAVIETFGAVVSGGGGGGGGAPPPTAVSRSAAISAALRARL